MVFKLKTIKPRSFKQQVSASIPPSSIEIHILNIQVIVSSCLPLNFFLIVFKFGGGIAWLYFVFDDVKGP